MCPKVDEVFERAVAVGAKVQPLENKFHGDRIGSLQDVPARELRKRADKMIKDHGG